MFKRDAILRPDLTLARTMIVPFIALLSVILVMPAVARVIYVPKGHGGEIQDSLWNAKTGDDIILAESRYDSTHLIWPSTDSITLASETGIAESCTLYGDGENPVIYMDGIDACLDAATVIFGFTIMNGRAESGGGISCLNASPLIRHNIFKGDTASYRGGAIWCDMNSSPLIMHNTIEENRAQWGGGICSEDTSCQTTIFANVIRNNSSYWGGGGIWCNNSLIDSNTISGNSGGMWGGGIGCEWATDVIIKDNWITENIATEGGGIFCQGCSFPSRPSIECNVIANNRAVLGGAIELWLSCPEISGNTIIGNISPSDYVGGIYNHASLPEISNNALFDNSCAIYLEETATIVQNNIYFNTYQPNDWELRNHTLYSIDAENNWWGVTDSLAIDSLIYDDNENSTYGTVDFSPPRNSANQNAPGEPGVVGKVVLKTDRSYTEDLIGEVKIGDTLYIQLEGVSWNGTLVDPALVIIASNSDPYGIATALAETGKNTGLYRGRAFVDTNSSDPYNRIRASSGDTIIISSNIGSASDSVIVDLDVHVPEDITDRSPPEIFGLTQNYPNPFNPITQIKYTLPRDCCVRLTVYNTLGRKVATLVDRQQRAGYKTVNWDASSFSSGIYFYQLQAGDFRKTRKMILLR